MYKLKNKQAGFDKMWFKDEKLWNVAHVGHDVR
jgi:hypothetical protein